jgi:hypothetical protein
MKERKVVADLQLPRGDWRVGMEGKERFTTSRGGLKGEDERKGNWLLIYNPPWRIEGWG